MYRILRIQILSEYCVDCYEDSPKCKEPKCARRGKIFTAYVKEGKINEGFDKLRN